MTLLVRGVLAPGAVDFMTTDALADLPDKKRAPGTADGVAHREPVTGGR
jgi:hypothetical protein